MLALLQFIVDSINTLIQLVGMLMNSTVNLIRMLPTFTTYTVAVFAWLPEPFAMFAVLGFSLSLIIFLLGRDT